MTEPVKKFPALFVGHGSPMNIIADNAFTRDMKLLGEKLPRPAAVLVVSAHWLTAGTFITGSDMPEQIFDFYGFPRELYKVNYRARGSSEIADQIINSVPGKTIRKDQTRGIDHAAWSVLKHMYPLQDIPVLELSLDIAREPL
jgi:4,5-DOPA dioxygenase extradiol